MGKKRRKSHLHRFGIGIVLLILTLQMAGCGLTKTGSRETTEQIRETAGQEQSGESVTETQRQADCKDIGRETGEPADAAGGTAGILTGTPVGMEEGAAAGIEAVIPVIPDPPASDDVFVVVSDYIPDIQVELKYATADNFTGQVIYDFTEARLRYGTVVKLQAVQEELKAQGLGLKIWDAYRPISAQFDLWAVCPDSTYVANPNKGYSSHSRGNTVDITLVDAQGNEVEMPTGFDDFTSKADRDYSDCDAVSAANARLLEEVMVDHGFKPYSGEWWHFSDTVSYPAE